MNRVLITGGAGFIGSHLAEAVISTGADVLVIDDFRLGRPEHLEDALATGSLRVIEGDIRNETILRLVTDYAPDTVFHMAALHFIPYCNAHPREALDVNVLALDGLLRALRNVRLSTFVFPSSGAIYGFGSEPWPETAPARPDEIYGISKWLGEQIMARFHADRADVRVVIARLFNTYGPRETNPHVLPAIMRFLREGKPVELGNLWPKRDLIFVTDTAAGLVAAAGDGHPGLEVFNVGTGIGTSVREVIQVIEGILGRPVEIQQVAERMRDGDGHLVSSPAKLMMATGWKPCVDLACGLRRLLKSEGLL
jgi:UDP-glucose 4-epimerase